MSGLQNNYLCTYDLYGPVRKVFDAGRYFMWGGGNGVAAGNLEFCGPCEIARADRGVQSTAICNVQKGLFRFIKFTLVD